MAKLKKINMMQHVARVGGVASGTMAADFVASKLLDKIAKSNRTVKGLILMAAGSFVLPFARGEFLNGAANGCIARGVIETGRGLNVINAISGAGSEIDDFVGAYADEDYDAEVAGDYEYEDNVSGTVTDQFMGS